MENSELIDKAIEIIKKHTRTEALGAFDCALRGYMPLDYEKCINEIAGLIEENGTKVYLKDGRTKHLPKELINQKNE